MSARTVHILDDDAPFRESLEFLLSVHGFTCVAHTCPTDLLAQLGPTDVGELVCDVRMPEMSGIEVARALAQRAPGVRVILVTGHADAGLVDEALRAGASHVLEKPFASYRLLELLQAGEIGSSGGV